MRRLIAVASATLALLFSGGLAYGQTTTSTGALQPPTFQSGKIVANVTAVAGTTSTQIAAPNASRIGIAIQCDTAPVKISETGATLTTATVVGSPAGTVLSTAGAYFIPQGASITAYTAYATTSGNCAVIEYNR